jgi:hypothetical protein
MQVRLTGGRVTNFSAQKPGAVINVSNEEGRRLVAAGQAVELALNPIRGVESRGSKSKQNS